MTGSLKRALGLWVAGQVDGLHIFSDDLANTKHRYPSCTILELSHDTEPVGCGKKDYTVRDSETGYVAASGKMHQSETVFRLTVSSPSNQQKSGQEIVDQILEAIESAVLLTKLSSSKLLLIDIETAPPEEYPVDKLAISNRQAIPPDYTSEPFLYRGAISLKVSYTVPVEKPVEHVIEQIHLQEG